MWTQTYLENVTSNLLLLANQKDYAVILTTLEEAKD